MFRRILMVGGALVAVLAFAAGPARADRLGGAYRGPYNDRQTTVDSSNPEVTTAAGGTAPEAAGGGSGTTGDAGGGGSGSGGGGASPPPDGGGGATGGGGDTGGGSNPPDSGGGSGDGGNGGGDAAAGGGGGAGQNPNAPPANNPPSAPATGFGDLTKPGGKVAQDDVYAFWPFWFEHNKEWILGELLRERTARARVPECSSSAIFSVGGAVRERTAVADDVKLTAIYPVLVSGLTDSSSWVRDAAVFALGKLGAPEGIEHLKKRLDDPQADIQEDALLALGLTGHKDALPPLLATLGSSDLNRKAFAALGLGLCGFKESVPPLVEALNGLCRSPKATDAVADAAACVAVAIGMLGDETAVKDLVTAFKRTSPAVRMYICQALGRIGGPDAQKWLVAWSSDKDKDVVAAANLALSAFPEAAPVQALLKGLKHGDRMVKLYSIVSLGRIGRSLAPDDNLRKNMAKQLKEMAEGPVRDKYMAMYAALGLAIMGDDSSNAYFLDYMAAENRMKFTKESLSAMAMALGLLEDKSASRDLKDIVSKGRVEADFRGYAAFALGIMGDASAKDVIQKTMADEKKTRDILRSGCWALGLLGDRSDVPELIDLLKIDGGNMQEVRGAAAIAIGLIGDNSAVAPLLKMAKDDPNSSHRAFAIAALGCLIDKDPVPRVPQIFLNTHFYREMGIAREVLMNL